MGKRRNEGEDEVEYVKKFSQKLLFQANQKRLIVLCAMSMMLKLLTSR